MKNPLRRRHPWITWVTFAVFFAASVSSVALWRMHNLQLLSVQSDSMLPVLRHGDAVVTKPVGLKSLASGDIVSYHDPLHPAVLITHRVVYINVSEELITTKGDNAPVADEPFDASLLVGKVTYGLPKLGYALDFLRSPAGLITGTYIPAAIIVWLELRNLLSSYGQPTYRLVSYIS